MNNRQENVSKDIHFRSQADTFKAFGEYDKYLKQMEADYNVIIHARGNNASVTGEIKDVKKVIKKFKDKIRDRSDLNPDAVIKTATGKLIKPLTEKQDSYLNFMKRKDLVVAIGPAGTGKTFLACVQAVEALAAGDIDRIVLTRPVVEAGEKLGFLPGDLQEKVNPYLRPLYDAFYTLLGPSKFQSLRKDEVIEIVPLAYMRGRTLDDAMIILDEAQNTSSGQMHMFLTRIGFNAKVVVTGDITQIDIEKNKVSGLIEIQSILKDIEDVKFIYFDENDVVRHRLVKKIINAYNEFKKDKRDNS
jgi:phosphate starvation-inducible PhoH-like protein